MNIDFFKQIGVEFNLPGVFQSVTPYGSGHINDTYRSYRQNGSAQNSYIHQRINHLVFKDPVALMDNIKRVTDHLHKKIAARQSPQPERETLTILPTRDGNLLHIDSEGNYWRTYIFIDQTQTYDVCPGLQTAYEAAKAFALFQADLTDLNGPALYETIPWFHHTPKRLEALKNAIQKDPCNRAGSIQAEIDFCLQRERTASTIAGLLDQGVIPLRVTHNDTKINNVLIDTSSGRGICVIDLDTVMNGSVLYDFGDMVRTVTRTCEEDEVNLDKVIVEPLLFEALARGYLESAKTFITPLEAENLVLSGQIITLTIGIRFLTDYLLGDAYFKISRPEHNLDRARVHFAMITQLEQMHESMQKIVQKYYRL